MTYGAVRPRRCSCNGLGRSQAAAGAAHSASRRGPLRARDHRQWALDRARRGRRCAADQHRTAPRPPWTSSPRSPRAAGTRLGARDRGGAVPRAAVPAGAAADALHREAVERLEPAPWMAARARPRPPPLRRVAAPRAPPRRRPPRSCGPRREALEADGRSRRSPTGPGASSWPPARRRASGRRRAAGPALTPQEAQIARLARGRAHQPRDRRAAVHRPPYGRVALA